MEDARNEILMELIDKMQTRRAEKEYPGEKKEPIEAAVAEVVEAKADAPADEEEISEEDLAALESETGE